MNSKLVSVIIPTYKRPIMLGRAINSVLNQSYKNVEVIVVDDNSDGDHYRNETIQFMQKYTMDSRVKYLKHKYNQNGSAARNTGILNSNGEYIAFLDDDDYFLKDRIVESVLFLQTSEEACGGVCCNYIKKYKSKIYKVSKSIGSYSSCYELLSGQIDFAAGSTLMIKKCILNDIGLFDVSFKRHQDWEFLIRFFRFYHLDILPNLGVVICADGIRNTPNTDQLLIIKNQMLKAFDFDISALGIEQQQLVYQTQWKEILFNYCKEKRYKSAFSFAKKNILISFCKIGDLLNLILAFIVGVTPNFMKVVYSLYNMKYSKIGKQIL